MLLQNVQYTLLFFFLIYNAVTVFKTLRILSRILKILVKIIMCSTLISVGSSYLLCMLAIYVFTVSSCVWVRSGVEISKVPYSCCCVVPLTPLEEQYRVSIQSFADYKHLLQENYCTWNTNFFFKM